MSYPTILITGGNDGIGRETTLELARRYPGVLSNCLHPGMVRTRFANKDSRWFVNLGWTLLKPFMRSIGQGAQTSVYLATSPELTGISGANFDQHQNQRRPSSRARDEGLAGKLWEVSETTIGGWQEEEKPT